MEYQRRRGRRDRSHRYVDFLTTQPNASTQNSKSWSFLNGIYNIVIMSSMIAIICLMLEYHYSTCMTKYEVHNITRNIEDIANDLGDIKMEYRDLENKISKFSQELPRLEGQIEILEALSKSLEKKNMDSDPQLLMPFVTTKVDYEHGDECEKLTNFTGKVCSKQYTSIMANQA